MKKNILISVCLMIVWNLHAQRTTEEPPYGLQKGFKAQAQDYVVLNAPDLVRIEKEDMENDQKPGPVRYAYPLLVNFTPENSGVWQELDDGSKVWRLKVNVPGALATVTYYDRFWLPKGAKFFLYSEETQQSIGAIISEFIGGSRERPIEFATALIYGENVVYEYFQPASVKEYPVLSINRIDYGYRYVYNPYSIVMSTTVYVHPNVKSVGVGRSIFYPNPVDDILYVDLDKIVNAQNKIAVICDIRLYDGQGNMLQQAKTKGGIEAFNVSNVPDGIYFLHIYDGVSPKPDVHKVVVKH